MDKTKASYFSNQDLRKLIIPLVIEQFLVVVVGLADSLMIAGVGEAAVSGVSLVDTINILVVNIFAALATGGAVVTGHFLGQRKKEHACRASEQLIIFTALLSIGVMLLVLVLSNWILYSVFGNIEADVRGYAKTYLQILVFAIPFVAIYNGAAAVFRAMGNSKIPMLVSLGMNVMNVAGNYILIFIFDMGVAGAAISSLVSRIAAAAVLQLLLFRKDQDVHLTWPMNFKIDWVLVKKILYIGVPNGLENGMFQLGKILVLSLVTLFGTAAITANAVCNTIAMFLLLPGMSISLAIVTVISQCIGAEDYEAAKYYTKKLMIMIYVSMIAVNVLILAGTPLIIRAYHLSPETAQITRQILIFYGIFCCVLWPPSFALPNVLRCGRDVTFTMVIAIISMWVFRVGFSYILGKWLGWGVFGVWMAMGVDWLFRSACYIFRYLQGNWQRMET